MHLVSADRQEVDPARREVDRDLARGLNRIDATVEDRASGKRLWQGWTVGALGQADSLSLMRKMVSPMVDGLGKTVTRQPLQLY